MIGNQVDPTKRFAGRASDYAKHRPRYPKALFDHLFLTGVLRRGSVVADIGSGTGIFSEPLLERGLMVYGVEPNQEMRQQAEASLHGYRDFISVDGRAEDTKLPEASVDLIAAAQAFHWFDLEAARKEFGRILRSGGQICIVYNERQETMDAFSQEFEDLFTQYAKADKENRERDREPSELFGGQGYKLAEFQNMQELDLEGLLGRTFSVSYMPRKGEAGHEQVVECIAAMFEKHQHGGRVVVHYRTQCYYGNLE